MLIKELLQESKTKIYYHGSNIFLPVGTILTPRFEEYEEEYGNSTFYRILEKYRPRAMLSHSNSVFMVDNDADIDNAGGGTEYVFTVKPLGRVERHDINWGSEIESLISEGVSEDDPRIITAANNYWEGVPHTDEQVWEYLTPKAKILTVEEY